MNKKVCIKIKGLHSAGEQEDYDEIEVIYIGNYYKRNGKHYIKYDEPIENSTQINKNTLKVSPKEVELMVNGATGHHMVFTAGQKNMTYYPTPYGGINMGIDTYSLEIVEEDQRIHIDITYGLEINLDYVSQCRVSIAIESVEDK